MKKIKLFLALGMLAWVTNAAIAVAPASFGLGGNVNVISTASNTVIATILVGLPESVAITPDGTKVYVTVASTTSVAVINTALDMVTTMIPVGVSPRGIAFVP